MDPLATLELKQASILRAVLDSVDSAVAFKDLDGRYLGCNPEYERVFGMTQAELAGMSDRDIFGPEEAARIRAEDREILDTGRPMEPDLVWRKGPSGHGASLPAPQASPRRGGRRELRHRRPVARRQRGLPLQEGRLHPDRHLARGRRGDQHGYPPEGPRRAQVGDGQRARLLRLHRRLGPIRRASRRALGRMRPRPRAPDPRGGPASRRSSATTPASAYWGSAAKPGPTTTGTSP